ncbi:MAG: lysophospholipid acyltransferase family protein [Planctomycetota bacterium]
MCQDKTTFLRRFLFYFNVAALKLVTVPLSRSIRGAEKLPAGACLIAANHRSLIDGILLVNELNRVRRRSIHMIAYREPFAHWFYGPIMRISGCLPFDRGLLESRVAVMRLALGYLEAGEPVAFFPEAHLSRTDTMRRGRPGLALLALETGLPVVPVGLCGTERVLEPGTGRFHLRRAASVEIGAPLELTHLRKDFLEGDEAARAFAVEEATTEVMRAIASLSGQQYPHEPRRRRTHPRW